LKSYDFPPLRVEVDGRVVTDNVPSLAFIGNVKEYGTGFPVLTRARPDDDLLDVCVLPCKAIGDFVKLATLTLTGAHVNQAGVVYEKGKSIRVESDRPVPVQLDGEAAGHTPLHIELLDSRLPFIVP
jgi:diacylglycerol kinase family enzyme